MQDCGTMGKYWCILPFAILGLCSNLLWLDYTSICQQGIKESLAKVGFVWPFIIVGLYIVICHCRIIQQVSNADMYYHLLIVGFDNTYQDRILQSLALLQSFAMFWLYDLYHWLVHLQLFNFMIIAFLHVFGKQMPVLYLTGSLLCPMSLLWEPVRELIATHARGMNREEFWDSFRCWLKFAAFNSGKEKIFLASSVYFLLWGISLLFLIIYFLYCTPTWFL